MKIQVVTVVETHGLMNERLMSVIKDCRPTWVDISEG
jgi:hypothetical protein